MSRPARKLVKRAAPSGPVILPVPADIDKAHVERKSAKTAIAIRRAAPDYTGGHATESERRRNAEQARRLRGEQCLTIGCKVPATLTGWCDGHNGTRKVSMDLEPIVPGLCNAPCKARTSGYSRSSRCKIAPPAWCEDGRCPQHRGIVVGEEVS